MDINIDPLAAFGKAADLATTVVNKIWPDKSEQEKMEIANAFALIQGQMEINKEEAKSASTFIAGWRPAAGWVCVTALALSYIPKALFLSGFWCYSASVALSSGGVLPPYPDLGVTDMLGLLFALLGIGGMRSLDKFNKVDTK